LLQPGAWNLLSDTVVIFMSDNGMTGGGSGRGVLGQLPDGTKLEMYNAGMKGQKPRRKGPRDQVPCPVHQAGLALAVPGIDDNCVFG
jgi:hypothetical protein